MNIKTIISLLKETFTEWQEDKAARLAAALAYYTVFSLAPLIIIVLGIAGFIFGQEAVGANLIQQMEGLIGKEGAEVTQSIIENASNPTSGVVATLVGVATLLFGASGVFGQLQDALNTIWGVAPKPGQGIWGFIESRFLSFTMVLGVGFLLMVSLVLSAGISALNNFLIGWMSDFSAVALQIINFVVSFGLITLLFAMIYKILPDVEIRWSDVWIGAAVTSFLFSAGKFLLGYYLGSQSFGSSYGAAGSILIILLWIYYSAQILLFGAEFTQVYAKKFGRIAPTNDAVAITKEMRAKQGIPRSVEIEAALLAEQRYQQQEAQPAFNKTATVVAEPRRDNFVTALLSIFLVGLFFRALTTSPKNLTRHTRP